MEALYSKFIGCGYKVSTDSRTVSGGEMFFAIRGENFDGNAYATKALDSGAAWAVVNSDAQLPDDPRLIRVGDPLQTLSDLAAWHRNHVRESLPVIGLTGTNGKTTTKELITAVLSEKFLVTSTKGNLNNDIGVPLSLLSIRPETEIAVIEMGASHPDDIAKLVKVSQPDYGLITNVGKAHLLGFGSFEGVKAAKGELYRWLGSHCGSQIFLNEDDADLVEMASREACHIFGYGLRYQNASILPLDSDNPFLRIRIGDDVVSTNLVGTYNATNVLAALAVGEFFGVNRKDAISAIGAYVPTNNRSQMTGTASNRLIVDAYNANPSSMSAALDNFAVIRSPFKLALLGDMRELGDASVAEHVKIVRKLVSEGIRAYLVGEEFRKALDSTSLPEDSPVLGWFPTSADLAAFLSANKVRDALVLVKGSRSIFMEKTLPEL